MGLPKEPTGSSISSRIKIVTSDGNKLFISETDLSSYLTEAPTDGNIYGRQNSSWVNVSGSGGETNTASNLGTGVGVYETKSGVDLQFNSLTSANNRLTIVEDDPNNVIQFTLVEGNIQITTTQITDLASYTGFDARYYTETEIDTQLANMVDYTGTPQNNQVAVFTDVDTVEGDANLTWDGSTFDVNGTLAADFMDRVLGAWNSVAYAVYDLDTLVETGYWYPSTGSTNTPIDGQSFNALLMVHKITNNNNLVQDFIQVNTTGNPRSYRRVRAGGTWGAWEAQIDSYGANFYRDDTSTVGGIVVIEQDGTGDTNLEFSLTGTQSYIMGIDNSATDNPFVISSGNTLGTNDKLEINPSGMIVRNNLEIQDSNEFGTFQMPYTRELWTHAWDCGTNTNWVKIADITVGTGLYQSVKIRMRVKTDESNFGIGGNQMESTYWFTCYRSAAVQDDNDTGWVIGKDHSTLITGLPNVRLHKASLGNYEIHIQPRSTYDTIQVEMQPEFHAAGTNYTFTPIRVTSASSTATITGVSYTPTDYATYNHVLACERIYASDIYTDRDDETGVIYLGDQSGGDRYLYYDGTFYRMPNATISTLGVEVEDVNPDYRWNTTGAAAIGSIWDAVLLDADNSLRIRSWDATETGIEKQFIYTSSGNLQIPGAITTTGENTFTRGTGGVSLDLASDVSFTGTILYAPGIRWQEADGTAIAGIRGYVDTSDDKHLALGHGWLNTTIDISSAGKTSVTGNLNVSSALTAAKVNVSQTDTNDFLQLYNTTTERRLITRATGDRMVFVPYYDPLDGVAYAYQWDKEFAFNFTNDRWEFDADMLYVGGQKVIPQNGSPTFQTITLGSNDVSTVTDIQLTDNSNIASTQNLNFYIDSDNNQTDRYFNWYHNAGTTTGATQLMSLGETGHLSVNSGNITAAAGSLYGVGAYLTSVVAIEAAFPNIYLQETDTGANQGNTTITNNNGAFLISATDDADAYIADIFKSTKTVTTGIPGVPVVADGTGGTKSIIHSGGSQSKTGPFGITGGFLSVGVNDTTQGVLSLYGPATGTEGGQMNLYNSAVSDGTIEYWALDTNNGNFRIFPNTGSFVHAFNVDGSVSFGGGISTTSLATNGASNLYTDNDGFQIGVQAADLYAFIAPVENGTPDYNKELQYVYADSRWRMEGEFNVTSNLLLGGRITSYQGAGSGQDGYVLSWNNTSGYFELVAQTTSGDVDLADNEKILIGTGDDLQIYHDGTDSFISKANDHDLYIDTSQPLGRVYIGDKNDSVPTVVIDDHSFKASTGGDGTGVGIAVISSGGSLNGDWSTDDLDVHGELTLTNWLAGSSDELRFQLDTVTFRTMYWDAGYDEFLFENEHGEHKPHNMLVFIESWDPPGNAQSKDFEIANYDDYVGFLVIGEECVPTGDSDFYIRWGNTSGTWYTGSTDYQTSSNYGSFSNSAYACFVDIGGGTSEGMSFRHETFNHNSAYGSPGGVTTVVGDSATGTSQHYHIAAKMGNSISYQTARLNRIRVGFSGDNWEARGRVMLYGYRRLPDI